jgi:very-short-patch-repair endonuclease
MDFAQDRTEAIFDACLNQRTQGFRDNFLDYLRDRTAGCESPIEKDLLTAMFFMQLPLHDEASSGDELPVICNPIWPLNCVRRFPDKCFVSIMPQAPVGPYRLDFLIGAKFHDRAYQNILAIECDGHEFHEKTKEQAAKDKSRDRALVSGGLRVMRFTGSEIYRDAIGCANQISEALFTIEYQTRPEELARVG